MNEQILEQVKKESKQQYINILIEIGRKQQLIDIYDKLKYDFDLESHEISEWYEEDKEELPKLYKSRDDIEKSIEKIKQEIKN